MGGIVNLTPHTIIVRTPGGKDITYPPSGLLARVQTLEEVTSVLENGQVPVIQRRMLDADIPTPADDHDWDTLIVSSMVLDAAERQSHPLRRFLVAPDTGPTAIRESGWVKAVTRWVRCWCDPLT